MILIRYLLVGLIVYLIVRAFIRYSIEEKPESRIPGAEKRDNINSKKISKKVGEYVDYEEVDK